MIIDGWFIYFKLSLVEDHKYNPRFGTCIYRHHHQEKETKSDC